MKKLLMGIGAAALMLATASCSKNSSSESQADKAFGDSLSTAMGQISGMQLNESYKNVPEDQQHLYKKEDILRGFKAVIMCDTLQQGYLVGVQQAMELQGRIMRLEMSDISVDRAKIYEAYSKAFMADSFSMEEAEELTKLFRSLNMQAEQRMMFKQTQREEAARKAQEEEAIKAAAGDPYVTELVKNDPSYTLSPSGIAYKVTAEGEGPAVGKGGSAKVKYQGRLTDGTVFDSNDEGIEFATNQVVPGFGEALSMLKKGEKMTVVIPAPLGYGSRDMGKIPANSTLIFDIEAVEVTPAE